MSEESSNRVFCVSPKHSEYSAPVPGNSSRDKPITGPSRNPCDVVSFAFHSMAGLSSKEKVAIAALLAGCRSSDSNLNFPG